MNNKYVYVMKFRSTGETYFSCVCANLEAVNHVAKTHNMENTYNSEDGRYSEYSNLKDKSQDAIVITHELIGG